MSDFVNIESPKLVKKWCKAYQQNYYFIPLLNKLTIGYSRQSQQELNLYIPSVISYLILEYMSNPISVVHNRITDAKSVETKIRNAWIMIDEQYWNVLRENGIHSKNIQKYEK